MKANARKALKQLGDPWAVELLLQALHDADVQVRREAARALSHLGDPRAVEPLVQTQ
jgi:HEAT repeat protein